MKPNAGQARAMVAMDAWWESGSPRPFVLHGVAGGGKTTVVRHWAASRGIGYQAVAPTAKAAALWPGGRTVHSLVYGQPSDPLYPMLKEAEQLEGSARRDALKRIRLLRPTHPLQFATKDAAAGGLIVLDEAMMVTREVGWDLASTGARILALGDPGQLHPIGGVALFTKPDAFLDEVIRQAPGSELALLCEKIRLSDARDAMALGRLLRPYHDPDGWRDADVVLGATRAGVAAHNRMRVDGRTVPAEGDLVVGLVNERGGKVFNGQRFTVVSARERGPEVDLVLKGHDDGGAASWTGTAPIAPFDHPDELEVRRNRGAVFTWGYAMTTHKAQGSGFAKVHVLQDWPRWCAHASLAEAKAWFYTSVSRASERLTTG